MSTRRRWRAASPISTCPTATAPTSRAGSHGSSRRRGRVRRLGRRPHADRRGRPFPALRRLERRRRPPARARARGGGRGPVRGRVRARHLRQDGRPGGRAALARPARGSRRPAGARLLGLPTRLGAPVGTLNVYCVRPRAWDESEVAALEAYNALLEARLAESLLSQRHDTIVGQLQLALDSRVTIERAIGLLMGRDGIDGADRLQRAARACPQLAAARQRRRRGGARRARAGGRRRRASTAPHSSRAIGR